MRTAIRTFAAALAAMAAVAAGPAACRADAIYGVTLFPDPTTMTNEFISINPATGVGTPVGPLAVQNPFGLASAGGNLYTYDSVAGTVDRIDPATGNVAAAVNVGIGPVLGQGALAFQTSSIGFLSSAIDPTTFNQVNDVFRFNLTTGTSTLLVQATEALEGLAVRSDGTLFALGTADGNLFRIDTTTGAMTKVGNIGFVPGNPVASLTFAPNGTLYASLNDTLYTINTSTGAATPVNPDPTASIGFDSVSGIAYVSSVPEPGPLALAAAVGLAAAAACRRGPAKPIPPDGI